jgi:D-glycero-alpha-D-manno-heptose-7-phosphate kinase
MKTVIARAPTRIDFGGGWTDVPPYDVEQGGCVCNLAITRHAAVNLTPHPGGVALDDDGECYEAASAADLVVREHAELLAAALRRGGLRDVLLAARSHFPACAGLGGSSAMGVALVAAVCAWRGESPDRAAIAERSRQLEVEDLGVAGGRQDHYAAAFGGALGLWFGEGVHVRQLPLSTEVAGALERRCVVAYTGKSRISAENITAVLGAYRSREPRVMSALARMRALAEEMVAALERAALDDLGALVCEHWQHQRALHPAITTPEIERVLDAARCAGALGGKALGASGGGCVLAVAPDERAADVRAAVARVAELVPFMVDREGVTVSMQGGA